VTSEATTDGERPFDGTTAWFHCFAGIAGDMALGALVDAGADLDEVRAMLRRLPVRGWSVEAEPVLRGGVAATHMVIGAADSSVVRTYTHITGLIEEARLPDRVRTRALAIFRRIAEVEAELHRRPIEHVHFHEVGGIDAIVDIVGVAAALEVLGVDRVTSSPVATGLGMIRSAHGALPNPAPAVVGLLAGAPTRGLDLNVELTTPTGAGILAALVEAWGPLPPMTITANGFGAGTRDLDALPNMTQVVLGAPVAATREDPTDGQPVVLVEANVDDVTGETLGHAVGRLLAEGAHDAWITPIVMKKGRPAHTVSVLADVSRLDHLRRVLAAETGTLGARGTVYTRWPARRRFEEVDVAGHPVRMKVSAGRVKVEHDDAVRVATRTGVPLREIVSLAEEAWRRTREIDSEKVVPLPAPSPSPDGDAG
jgi:pyridinium-3,5-bisthiocarboxylic acid mononucleotide nickel chelatase